MNRFLGSIAFGIPLLLSLAGCAPIEPEPTARVETAEIYFVLDTPQGLKLVSEVHEFDTTVESIESAVLSAMVSGELQPFDPDYFNLWVAPNELIEVAIEGKQATVDLNPVTLNVGAEGEAAAINQIVWTLTGLTESVSTVSFLVDGQPAESFAGHVDTLASQERGIDFEVLNGIQISSLLDGAIATNPVSISGEACTFEATVHWVLMLEGSIVDEGSTLASEACPTRSAWAVDLGKLSPGTYEFLAQDFSMKDGALVVEDSKIFEVRNQG